MFFALPLLAQPPAIHQEGARNAASMMPSSLPGAAIARGARFVVLGLRFSSDSRVIVSDRQASVLEVRNDRIEALMPESAPLGEVSLIVTNQDGNSRPFRVRVARSSPGLYQREMSAAPGGDVSMVATGIDPRVALELYIGGVKTPVRAVEPAPQGIYHVRFQMPRAALLGCFVPIYARDSEGHVSNSVQIAIHRPGQPCDDGPAWPFANMPTGGSGALVGLVRVHVSMSAQGKPVRNEGDVGFAALLSADPGERPFSAHEFRPPPGTCRMDSDLTQPGALPTLPAVLLTLGKMRGLSAGPAIQVEAGRASALLPPVPEQPGLYSGTLGGEFPIDDRRRPLPLFLGPEEIVVSAPGSTIGAFRLRLPGLPRLEWSGHENLHTVDRARGLNLNWSSAGKVLIVAMNVDQKTAARTTVVCQPPTGAQHFRLSPDILANFPATTKDRPVPMGWIGLVTLPSGKGVPFKPEGVDAGYGMTIQMIARSVDFR